MILDKNMLFSPGVFSHYAPFLEYSFKVPPKYISETHTQSHSPAYKPAGHLAPRGQNPTPEPCILGPSSSASGNYLSTTSGPFARIPHPKTHTDYPQH